MNDMAKLLEKSKVAVRRLKPADVVEGVVSAKTKDELILDIGAKAEGLVTGREYEESAGAISPLKEGDKVLATVIQSEDSRGFVLLSLKKAEIEADWREAKIAMEAETVSEMEILGPNRGGVVAKFNSLRGFIPFSHLSLKNKMAANLGQLTGKVVKAKVIEMDQGLDRLVLSEREAQTQGEREQDFAALAKVKVGEQYEGEVTSVTPFAAFVQFTPKGEKNPVEGTMHVSEISWEKVA
ncbi:MAG: S1 RNA-binding domain-containing protein, partial [Patescibacteria group bacterium]